MELTRPAKEKKALITWLLCGCFLVYLMVVIGGITRLTHSGLSMVEWNMIIGSFPPTTDADWQEPFQKYQQTPEYQVINTHFTLEEFKSIYWWEYTHRFLGRFIGLVFLLPFLWFLVRKKLDPPLIKNCLIMFALGGFQGILGWYMVKSGLVKDPHVSHFRLAAHLLSAFAVFGFTFWVALGLLEKNKPVPVPPSLRKWGIALFSVIVLQIMYGAFTAGLGAGKFYNTWPKMGEEWMPDTVWAYDTFLQNISENKAGIQFIHRCLAYTVVLFVLILWNKARKAKVSKTQSSGADLLALIVTVQFLLGVYTLLYSVPVAMGVLHQTGAFLLFAASILFLHRTRA